jgi:hypothetical protein
MIGTDLRGFSVRELITFLEECPNKDAWVVFPESPKLGGGGIHDPFRKIVGVRATNSATVELVGGDKGYY